MRYLRLLLALVAVGAALSACGDNTETLPSDLPRTTEDGISITVADTEESLPLAGCHTLWASQGKEPPPGTCEQTKTVSRYVARNGSGLVETWVVGDVQMDPLYVMNVMSHDQADGMSIIVVAPPPQAVEIRLVSPTGEILDRTTPTGPLVALAGLGTTVNVEALSDDGDVIAACPHDGILINGVVYLCTIAPSAEIPVTSTTTK